MNINDVLTQNGIAAAPAVVAIAQAQNLDLAAACTMLDMETDGGRNVWGHDVVNTGGYYKTGDVVTAAAYQAWKPHRLALGSQGVGPCQLTSPTYQDQADAIGGCWNPIANMTVGFRVLVGLIAAHGLHDGFKAYNGSGKWADIYATTAMATYQRWAAIIGGTNVQWTDPIPDYYAPGRPDLKASDALAWSAAHAAMAMDASRQCVSLVQTLQQQLIKSGVIKA